MAYANTLASQSHGVNVTTASTQNDGAQIVTTAGDQTTSLTGDVHFGKSIHLGPIAVGQSRPLQMLGSGTATSAAFSIEFMVTGYPGTANARLAGLEGAGGGFCNTFNLSTTGTVIFTKNGGTVFNTSTTKLNPYTLYRLDMFVTGMGTTTATVRAAICYAGSNAFDAIAADLDKSTTADLSSTGYVNLKSIQFGYLSDQSGQKTGTMVDTYWAAPRLDEGTTTPVVGWLPPTQLGTAVRATNVVVRSGSASASGTRTGESTPLNSLDINGAMDGDSNTRIDSAAGSSLEFIRHSPMTASGDLTVTLSGATDVASAQLTINGANVGSPKTYTGSPLVWTKAEQGNPASNSSYVVGVVLS